MNAEPMALPSELIEPMLVSALNLAVTRLVEEGPSDEAAARFVARVEGVHYVIVCNSCNQATSEHNGVHASLVVGNFMRMAEKFKRASFEDRQSTINRIKKSRR